MPQHPLLASRLCLPLLNQFTCACLLHTHATHTHIHTNTCPWTQHNWEVSCGKQIHAGTTVLRVMGWDGSEVWDHLVVRCLYRAETAVSFRALNNSEFQGAESVAALTLTQGGITKPNCLSWGRGWCRMWCDLANPFPFYSRHSLVNVCLVIIIQAKKCALESLMLNASKRVHATCLVWRGATLGCFRCLYLCSHPWNLRVYKGFTRPLCVQSPMEFNT